MNELAETVPAPTPAEGSIRPESVPEEDRYRTLDTLGRGGMGEVRLCLDRRIGREVAIKVSTTAANQRFLREALLAARLEHPAFVPVYDVRVDDAGAPSFTMRRVRGRTLRDVLSALAKGDAETKAEHTRPRLLAAFVQLCLALDYAHQRGVVHRDVKPENVMLGDFGEVYLLDWGVAKARGEPEPAHAEADLTSGATLAGTAAGVILGTPGYMAPEQWAGDSSAIDARADVFALGALLFEMVALEPMVRGGSLFELRNSTEKGLGRSPLRRAPAREVPPELDAICLSATAPDPAARHESARALAHEVQRFLDGDRDLALRRAHSIELAAGAERALADAGGDPEARAQAGREAVRALAFDADNALARATLTTVLTEPPARVPEEARASVDRSRREAERALLSGAWRVLIVVCGGLTLALLASGVIAPSLLAAVVACAIGATCCFAWAARGGPDERWLVTIGFALLAATNLLFTRWASPFVAVPMTMVVNVTAFSMYANGRARVVRGILGALTIVVPMALEALGAWEPAYRVEHGTLVILPRLAHFGPWLPWVLGALGAGTVFTAPLVLGFAVDRARDVELRFHAQAWVLRAVLALDTNRVSGGPAAPSS